MNILTFDTEEWFHLLDCDATRTENEWKNYEVRIYENVDRILSILDDTNTKATFFVIGWVAKTYPDLVKKIASKYQIGSHTENHQLVWQQSPAEFREDVSTSIKRLEDITGQKVEAFRAPGFSIRESEAWAFDIMAELGIKYDCSVFPAHHAHGGMPSFEKAAPAIISHGSTSIKEFPVCFKTIAGKHLMYNGGGYFRLFPYSLIKKWTKESDDYVMSYIHPRDLDAGQPMIESLPLARKFKSYVGLKGAEKKLRKYLTDFDFMDLNQANELVDWSSVQKIEL